MMNFLSRAIAGKPLRNRFLNRCYSTISPFGKPYWAVPIQPAVNQNFILRPFLFTAIFTAACFGTAYIVDYERHAEKVKQLIAKQAALSYGVELESKSNNSTLDKINRQLAKTIPGYDAIYRRLVNQHGSDGVVYGLVGANILVFLLWRVCPSKFMLENFAHHPGLLRTMITSMFSHATGMHLAFNMIGLYSFGIPLARIMGPDQFLAFYLTGGLCSTLASHSATRMALKKPDSVISKFIIPNGVKPSLGASGAVLAVVGASAYKRPETRVAIIFLPFVAFPLKYAVQGLAVLDVVGLLSRASRFDHIAHLSGLGLGYSYFPYLKKQVWEDYKNSIQSRYDQHRLNLLRNHV